MGDVVWSWLGDFLVFVVSGWCWYGVFIGFSVFVVFLVCVVVLV